MAQRARTPATQIKDTVMSVVQGWEARRQSTDARDEIEAILKNALTKKEFGHIKVKYFTRGIVGVTVDSAVWRYQIQLQKGSLLGALREKRPEVEEITFRVGELR